MILGLLLVGVVATAVTFISANLGGPTMLYALLFGMAFSFLGDHQKLAAGIRFAGRQVLRLGVGLLGARITVEEVGALGWEVLSLIAISVGLTILIGWRVGRVFGLSRYYSILAASAVAICGASAALAVSSVLPKYPNLERDTALTVVGVTALSTIAMILYPAVVLWTGVDETIAGVFLGATIHDVAQVVGAGYIVSDAAGDTSTLVKLIRVSLLVPVVLGLSLMLRSTASTAGWGNKNAPLIPWFLVTFVALVFLNSRGLLSSGVAGALNPISSWCLLIGIAAVGMRTSLASFADVGLAPIAALVCQTLLLAVFVAIGLRLVN